MILFKKIINILLELLAELRCLNDEEREFHWEIALGRKKFRVAEDLEKGRFRFKSWERRKI